MTSEDRRFPFEEAAKLDAPERQEHQPTRPLVDLLQLAPKTTVLDLGAGTGYFALPIAKRLASLGGTGRVLALDVEPRMLDVLTSKAESQGLRRRVSLLQVSGSAASRLPVEDAAVDRILLANLYHELPEPGATLRELHRVLRPGGLIVIVDWDPAGRSDKGPPPHHRVSPEEVAAQLEKATYQGVTQPAVYEDYYVLVARR